MSAQPITPRTTQPRFGESFTSWFARYSHLQNASEAQVFHYIGLDQRGEGVKWGVSLDDISMRKIAESSRNTACSVDATHHAADFGALIPHATSVRDLERRSWIVSKSIRFCPTCLDESGFWRRSWEHGWNTVCAEHQCLLTFGCTHCDSARRGPVESPSRTLTHPLACGTCEFWLPSSTSTAATAEQMALQEHIDAQTQQLQTHVFGLTAPVYSWLRVLESAVGFLMHLQSAGNVERITGNNLPRDPQSALSVLPGALDACVSFEQYDELLQRTIRHSTRLRKRRVVPTFDLPAHLRKRLDGEYERRTEARSTRYEDSLPSRKVLPARRNTHGAQRRHDG